MYRVIFGISSSVLYREVCSTREVIIPQHALHITIPAPYDAVSSSMAPHNARV